MSCPRGGCAAAAVGDVICVVGGRDDGDSSPRSAEALRLEVQPHPSGRGGGDIEDKRGTNHTEAFDDFHKQGLAPFYIMRLNLVGASGSGKTSTLDRLKGKTFENTQSSVGLKVWSLGQEPTLAGADGSWTEAVDTALDIAAANAILSSKKGSDNALPGEDAKSTSENSHGADKSKASSSLLEAGSAPVPGQPDERTVSKEEVDSSPDEVTERDASGKPKASIKYLEAGAARVTENNDPGKSKVSTFLNAGASQVPKRLPEHLLTKHGESSTTFRIQAWDFPGQGAYADLNILHFTSKAIYLVTVNLCRDLDKEFEELVFWLKNVHLYAPKAPILIVGTHKSLLTYPLSDLEDKLLEFLTKNPEVAHQIQRSPGLSKSGAAIVAVENSDPADQGIPQVRGLVDKIANEMLLPGPGTSPSSAHVGLQGKLYPLHWLYAHDMMQGGDLLQGAASSSDSATLCHRQHVAELLEKAGSEKGSEEVDDFLRLLHELGILVWVDRDGLRETVITQPRQLSLALGAILYAKHEGTLEREEAHAEHFGPLLADLDYHIHRLRSHGIASRSLLEGLWTSFNESERVFLRKVMLEQQLLIQSSEAIEDEFWVPLCNPEPCRYIVPLSHCPPSSNHICEICHEAFPMAALDLSEDNDICVRCPRRRHMYHPACWLTWISRSPSCPKRDWVLPRPPYENACNLCMSEILPDKLEQQAAPYIRCQGPGKHLFHRECWQRWTLLTSRCPYGDFTSGGSGLAAVKMLRPTGAGPDVDTLASSSGENLKTKASKTPEAPEIIVDSCDLDQAALLVSYFQAVDILPDLNKHVLHVLADMTMLAVPFGVTEKHSLSFEMLEPEILSQDISKGEVFKGPCLSATSDLPSGGVFEEPIWVCLPAHMRPRRVLCKSSSGEVLEMSKAEFCQGYAVFPCHHFSCFAAAGDEEEEDLDFAVVPIPSENAMKLWVGCCSDKCTRCQRMAKKGRVPKGGFRRFVPCCPSYHICVRSGPLSLAEVSCENVPKLLEFPLCPQIELCIKEGKPECSRVVEEWVQAVAAPGSLLPASSHARDSDLSSVAVQSVVSGVSNAAEALTGGSVGQHFSASLPESAGSLTDAIAGAKANRTSIGATAPTPTAPIVAPDVQMILQDDFSNEKGPSLPRPVNSARATARVSVGERAGEQIAGSSSSSAEVRTLASKVVETKGLDADSEVPGALHVLDSGSAESSSPDGLGYSAATTNKHEAMIFDQGSTWHGKSLSKVDESSIRAAVRESELQTRRLEQPECFHQDLKSAVDLVVISKSTMELIGSALYIIFRFFCDVDLDQWIPYRDSPGFWSNLATDIQAIWRRVKASKIDPKPIFAGLKAGWYQEHGESKSHIWSADEVRKGQKTLPTGESLSLKDALQSSYEAGIHIKVDVWAPVDDIYLSITTVIKVYTDQPSAEALLTNLRKLKKEILTLLGIGLFVKASKRVMVVARLKDRREAEKVVKLTAMFSDVPAELAQICAHLNDLNEMQQSNSQTAKGVLSNADVLSRMTDKIRLKLCDINSSGRYAIPQRVLDMANELCDAAADEEFDWEFVRQLHDELQPLANKLAENWLIHHELCLQEMLEELLPDV
eukprot:TRINITY_DN6568_c0_g1_i5.p1 TRINITY_DN6568_c0_g1~~TRINITY_DN6568_c0_g1_i5.p1  ORF type:complete len:1597 (+),score=277.49 TRINITY_DN6568_c0_g1_i5:597-5387(+)